MTKIHTKSLLVPEIIIDLVFELPLLGVGQGRFLQFASLLGFPAGLSRPGKSREGPGTRRNRTGPRDLEGPVVLAGQDLETQRVPGLFFKGPGTSRPL